MAKENKKPWEEESIVPLNKRGHLVIPITNKKYKITYAFEVELTYKDFEEQKGTWKKIIDDLEKGYIRKHFFPVLFDKIGDATYNQLKKKYPADLKKVDLVKICNMLVMKYKKETFININLDGLKEVK